MNILDQLADHARRRVAAAKAVAPEAEVRRRALELPRGDFTFEKALSGDELAFICECKRASPSKGLIAPDFPYLDIAQDYEAAGAEAISVLTEPGWFLGSDDILREIAGRVSVPCLRKDFTVDEYMLYQAKLLGASAALLICAILDGSQVRDYIQVFIEDKSVRLIGCEAAGRGVDTFETAATIATGRLGIFHGMKSYFCQDAYGQIAPVYSISAGLDYPGIGPEHAWLHDTGRAEYVPVTDDEAVNAFEYLSRMEGIIPAIESAHAVAHAMKLAPSMGKDRIMVVNISGRGDKDCAAIARYRGGEYQ